MLDSFCFTRSFRLGSRATGGPLRRRPRGKTTGRSAPRFVGPAYFKEELWAWMFFGRKPDRKCGEYFRASVWMWQPLHWLMEAVCSDLLGEELLWAMAANEGAGPECANTCQAIADRIERAIADYPDGLELDDAALRVTEEGRFVTEDERRLKPELKTYSPYRVSHQTLVRWVEFVRHCGGFAVW